MKSDLLQTPPAKAMLEALNLGLNGLEINHRDTGLGGKDAHRVTINAMGVKGKSRLSFEGAGRCPDSALLNLAGQIEVQCVRGPRVFTFDGAQYRVGKDSGVLVFRLA